MRKVYVVLVLLLFFGGYGFSVSRMEKILGSGDDLLLALAPVDPRALLMGDYMELEYTLNERIRKALAERGRQEMEGASRKFPARSGMPEEGYAVLRVEDGDIARVGRFIRLDDGTPLAENELLLRFKVRGSRVLTAAPAFYFQEGTARVYENARFGRLKVGPGGKALLVALCDAKGEDIVVTVEKE